MSAKPIPDGYHTVTPYLVVQNAASAIEFYKKAFGAEELMRLASPDGKIGHAEIKIGDSPIMLADEFPEMGYRGPQALGGSPVSIMLYVEDVDACFNQAIAAGAKVKRPVKDEFYGDRVRQPRGSVRSCLDHRNSQRGCFTRRDREALRSRYG